MCRQNKSTMQPKTSWKISTSYYVQQPGGNRPPTAKPKDPSELNIEDEELAKDYRKMYERFTEMEAKMAAMLQRGESGKDIENAQKDIDETARRLKEEG